MADSKTRVDIGFQGGGMVSTRLTDAEFTTLVKAVEKGEGWHQTPADDGGEISLRVDRVIYLNRESSEQRVGF